MLVSLTYYTYSFYVCQQFLYNIRYLRNHILANKYILNYFLISESLQEVLLLLMHNVKKKSSQGRDNRRRIPKAILLSQFFKLPQNVTTKILIKCKVSDLAKLALVSKRCRDMVLYWLEGDTRLSIFPCLVSYNMKLNSIKYQTNGSSKLYRLEPSRTRRNFVEVNMTLSYTPRQRNPIILRTLFYKND